MYRRRNPQRLSGKQEVIGLIQRTSEVCERRRFQTGRRARNRARAEKTEGPEEGQKNYAHLTKSKPMKNRTGETK